MPFKPAQKKAVAAAPPDSDPSHGKHRLNQRLPFARGPVGQEDEQRAARRQVARRLMKG